MGYYASAYSEMHFIPHADIEKLCKKVIPESRDLGLDLQIRTYGIFDDDGSYRSAAFLSVGYDGNYHSEDVEKALKLIAPYVTSDSIIYFNGDNAKWCFELDGKETGEWIERNCYDYYECDLDHNAQFVIRRQGFPIGLTNEELKKIYEAIGRGEISIDEEEEK